jgi:hypothetical protein
VSLRQSRYRAACFDLFARGLAGELERVCPFASFQHREGEYDHEWSLYFGNGLFSEFYRLQRQIDELFRGFPSSIRSVRRGAFPQVNIGVTDMRGRYALSVRSGS